LAQDVRGCIMREGISLDVSASERERLATVVADRNSPQTHLWRARIILATAEGCGTAEIMRRAGVSKPCVWRWQERFMREGVAGLLSEKTRKPGLPPLPPALVERVVGLTLTGRFSRRRTGLAERWRPLPMCRCVRCRGSGRRTARSRTASGDSSCPKIVVGLYLDPPAHSLVLSVDEKSQIQASTVLSRVCR